MKEVPTPDYPKSKLIKSVELDRNRYHKGDGDMWPLTWADDDNLYGGAGDNLGSPMNFWRIERDRSPLHLFLVDNLPVDPAVYCAVPEACPKGNGIKPAGLLFMDGTMYFAVECMNYGDNPEFNRQHNLYGWIITTTDYGKTWNREATPTDFFTGRLCSCHFLQYGKANVDALDEYVYAYFPGVGDDGNSYWENGDYILLGRVPRERLLDRSAWEFCTNVDADNNPSWSSDDAEATAIFRYPLMTGEDHVSYNPGIERYILGNYGFYDDTTGKPRPYHHGPLPDSVEPSQLTLFEAPEPWGPWSLFYRDDRWGTYGDYQPNFPDKYMREDGLEMCMVSAGTFDDYNFTVQKMRLEI